MVNDQKPLAPPLQTSHHHLHPPAVESPNTNGVVKAMVVAVQTHHKIKFKAIAGQDRDRLAMM